MDPENPVVKLCVQGMQVEGVDAGRHSAQLFQKAWELSSNDFERCIAAHYVARHQHEPSERIAWNSRALKYAEACGDPRAIPFLPSLALNLANAHERAGNVKTSYELYIAAERYCESLSKDGYGKYVRDGIANGLARMANACAERGYGLMGEGDASNRREGTGGKAES